MDINKSQADDNSCRLNVIHVDPIQIENKLEEQETQNKKQNQLHIDTIPNATTESRLECELDTEIITKEQEQHEQSKDSKSYIDKRDKKVEKSPKINEKIQKKTSQDNMNEWEEMDDEVLNSLSLFHDEVKSND